MKYRSDFVTNSSSSCYVIALDKNLSELTENDITEWVCDHWKNDSKFIKFILDTFKRDGKEISFSEFREEAWSSLYYQVRDMLEKKGINVFEYGRDELYRMIDGYVDEILAARVPKNSKYFITDEYDACEGIYSERLDYNETFNPREHIFFCSHH